jgi:hypothetical protein
MERHRRLAVGLLAQRPAALALHAHRMRAGLGEGRVIQNKDACWIGKRFRHQGTIASTQRPLVPRALADELLQALIGIARALQSGGQRHPAAQRLDALALAVLQQAGQAHPAPGALARPVEVPGKMGRVRFQALQRARVKFRGKGSVHDCRHEPPILNPRQ